MTRRLPMLLVFLVALAQPAHAQDEGKSLTSFAELRADVLDAIGGASRRVWLVTDYLTDPARVEGVSGNAVLNGIPVVVTGATPRAD